MYPNANHLQVQADLKDLFPFGYYNTVEPVEGPDIQKGLVERP